MGVEEDEMIGIMLLMDTPQKQDKLMMWMSTHREATLSDILGKAMEISKGVVLTPKYWNEEEYLPLIEKETAFGNKVKIPEKLRHNGFEV